MFTKIGSAPVSFVKAAVLSAALVFPLATAQALEQGSGAGRENALSWRVACAEGIRSMARCNYASARGQASAPKSWAASAPADVPPHGDFQLQGR
jgi:hypothetical protein